MRLHELRQLVGTGKYEIDTQAVADALLRRRPLGDTRAGDRDRDPVLTRPISVAVFETGQ